MTWQEALESLADHPHAWRYRELCDEANPDARQREKYRAIVIRKATGEGEYPPVMVQAGNALAAAGRLVTSGGAMVDEAEMERRMAICLVCEHFDPEQGRCRVCGCVARWKARLATEHCPLPEPKW